MFVRAAMKFNPALASSLIVVIVVCTPFQHVYALDSTNRHGESLTPDNKNRYDANSQRSLRATSDRYRTIKLRSGQGGGDKGDVASMKESPLHHGVYADLLAYTGLSPSDLDKRLERRDHFHFEGEHAWWDPKSVGELTWFYRSSVSYLFANADHPQESDIITRLRTEDGPVLDYSGGVGSTVLGLASKNISCHYFGIGLQEFAFAEFRVARKGMQQLVNMIAPYALIDGEYRFHAYKSIPHAKYGAIVAIDVLEHIPDYQVTARHLVGLLRPGGLFFESSPFDDANDDPLAIHQRARVSMAEALTGMELVEHMDHGVKVWRKV